MCLLREKCGGYNQNCNFQRINIPPCFDRIYPKDNKATERPAPEGQTEFDLLADALGRACEFIGQTFDCPFSDKGHEFEDCSDQCGETGEKTTQCWIRYFKEQGS